MIAKLRCALKSGCYSPAAPHPTPKVEITKNTDVDNISGNVLCDLPFNRN